MSTAAQAYLDGRTATVGDTNPYSGQGIPARMWQIGYDKLLQHLHDTSSAYQQYLDAQ